MKKDGVWDGTVHYSLQLVLPVENCDLETKQLNLLYFRLSYCVFTSMGIDQIKNPLSSLFPFASVDKMSEFTLLYTVHSTRHYSMAATKRSPLILV